MSVEDVEDVDPANLVSKLSDALDPRRVDYTAIKVILKVLRAVVIDEPVEFIEKYIELIYHTPRDFCLLIGGLAQRNPDKVNVIADKLVETIQAAPFRDMSLSRIWVAHLFVTQALPINEIIREKMDLSKTVVEQRQDLLLRGLLRDRAFFRAQKTKFDEANDWAKRALMLGAACLSTSESRTWLDTIQSHVADPTSNLYRKWLKDNQSIIWEKLREDYIIKTRVRTH